METKHILLFILLGLGSSIQAQKVVSDTTRQQHTFRLHNGTEVTETRIVTVIEEPAEPKPKKKKFQINKPKNMKYRLALLEVEFETENYRKRLEVSNGDTRKALLQELINKIYLIKDVKQAEYNSDYTQIVVLLPDDSEYRVAL